MMVRPEVEYRTRNKEYRMMKRKTHLKRPLLRDSIFLVPCSIFITLPSRCLGQHATHP